MDDDSKWNTQGRDQWNEKAEFWDLLHGDRGNAFSRMIVEPAVERLLGLRRGEHVVDAACGNGALARRLAAWGARVLAFDFSERLIDLARTRDQAEPIEYVVADATDEAAIARMGEHTFDSAICTMAFMDMPTIAPLYRGIHCQGPADVIACSSADVIARLRPAEDRDRGRPEIGVPVRPM